MEILSVISRLKEKVHIRPAGGISSAEYLRRKGMTEEEALREPPAPQGAAEAIRAGKYSNLQSLQGDVINPRLSGIENKVREN